MGGAIQGKALKLDGNVSTLAGQPYQIKFPYGVIATGADLYVTDTINSTIRKVVKATGEVTTLAGSFGLVGSDDGIGAAARFYYPTGITTDGTNLYVTDTGNNTIRKVMIATGEVTTLAGSDDSWGSTDGIGAAAGFEAPHGITTDGANLYVTDSGNNTIRKVEIATGLVTTLAGRAGSNVLIDATGFKAPFNQPTGIATDGTNLYVADTGNATIRQVALGTGVVTTLAGGAQRVGSSDGIGSAAWFYHPSGISTDGTNLFVTDTGNYTIRKVVIATGAVSTLVSSAQFNRPSDIGFANWIGELSVFLRREGLSGVTTDGTNLYVANTGDRTIHKVDIATGAVTTLVSGGDGASDGSGKSARFKSPTDVTTDGTNLYVADLRNNTIRKVVIATGAVTTLAGSAGASGSTDGIGTTARFNNPYGVTTDGKNLYVTDRGNGTIRKVVIATGEVTTLAGNAGISGTADGTGPMAKFFMPHGITTDGRNLYVTDSGNNTIRKVVIATREVTTLAGSAGIIGSTDATGSLARFNFPFGIVTDGNNLYVTDRNNCTIRKIVIATGEVTTIAGGGNYGQADGLGRAARFDFPTGMTTDGTNLYVADAANNTIRKVVVATTEVTTLAGRAGVNGSADDTGSLARFDGPYGITTDGISLYVADLLNNTIRTIK